MSMPFPAAHPTPGGANEYQLRGKVAIVTGSSSGLGRRFAEVLAGQGMRVVVSARRAERLRELEASLGPEDVSGVAGDMCDPGFPSRLVDAACERFGGVDVLVNNAGAVVARNAEGETIEDFVRVLQINLVSLFACCQAVHRPMKAAGGGSIVNIASVFGLVGSVQIPAASYAASKGGVVNLTRELAAQWASDSIRVNSLAPGWFPSEMTQDVLDNPRGAMSITRAVPMGRPGRDGELDGALLFLAGATSGYLTGQTIVVDGGYTSI